MRWMRLLVGLLVAGPSLAQTPQPDRLWFGPMPFISERTVRPDFFSMLAEPAHWPVVLARTQVFKSYLMLLPDVPVTGKTEPELSDDQLRQLATMLRRRGLKVAFEVGGLRMGATKPMPGQWGKAMADAEFTHLQRWLEAGGTIDYLTTDHAVMMNLGHRVYQGNDCSLSLRETMRELADYFVIMQQRLPGVRVGCIESLGFFHVTAPDGSDYPRTVEQLPVWAFAEYFATLIYELKLRGVKLDHFHMDFGYEGVAHDAARQNKPGLDYGRLLGVEKVVREAGTKCGVILNAYHEQSIAGVDAHTASREARERTQRFLDGYAAAGGKSEHIVLQTWQPYPDRTGPETDADTVLGMTRNLLLSRAMRRLLR